MFDRFTDRARNVMGLSRGHAIRLKHDYIGTEHILLGILDEGNGVASCALKNLDIRLDDTRRKVEELTATGSSAPPLWQLPFTPRAKKVMELALEEAAMLGHTYIGTEHLLLGLLQEGSGIAASALAAMKVKLEDVRAEVLDVLGANESLVADGKHDDANLESEAALKFIASLPLDGVQCDHNMRHQETEPACSGWLADVRHAIGLARAALNLKSE